MSDFFPNPATAPNPIGWGGVSRTEGPGWRGRNPRFVGGWGGSGWGYPYGYPGFGDSYGYPGYPAYPTAAGPYRNPASNPRYVGSWGGAWPYAGDYPYANEYAYAGGYPYGGYPYAYQAPGRARLNPCDPPCKGELGFCCGGKFCIKKPSECTFYASPSAHGAGRGSLGVQASRGQVARRRNASRKLKRKKSRRGLAGWLGF